MKYEKPSLTLGQQADLLLSRGMAGDRNLMVERLGSVNYYRLSGYWHPFVDSKEQFEEGTSFETVWARYAFDRRLRLVVMDAIERVEIAIRTWLAYHHSQSYGPFAYATDPTTLSKLTARSRQDFLNRIKQETDRSKEDFVSHFRHKYGDSHDFLPVWVATEVMNFGTVLTFYRETTNKVKKAVSSELGIPPNVLASWLLTLNSVRNICAHHGRLWNRVLGVKPVIPLEEKYPEWHDPVKIGNSRVFGVLSLCQYCLKRVAPQSGWQARLSQLLSESPEIPTASMGFPEEWEASPLWG